MTKFEELRKKYKEFIYEGFSIEEDEHNLYVSYSFRIEGLESFNPSWVFRKNGGSFKNDFYLNKLVFNLGMVELISYWKISCPETITVKAGELTAEQLSWWKKQYFLGLGEFFYVNGINPEPETFVKIKTDFMGTEEGSGKESRDLEGCLVPIGGGKDSAVTLSLLPHSEKNRCYIINPRPACTKTAEAAGYADSVISVKRTLDENMLRLNSLGYLNGHTPYSAIVAFSSLITAYMNGLKYVVLSNEASANESTVIGSFVNHQYSKSFEFENDFNEYEEKYINCGVKYFSLLRCFSEFQIAALFSMNEKYFKIFRSCNAGSKTDSWCARCPKCLFVFLILSPFLSTETLTGIFNNNMADNNELMPIFKKLIGEEKEKPFECVGSVDEINAAICIKIENSLKSGEELPCLLKYYYENGLYEKHSSRKNGFFDFFNKENLIPSGFQPLVKSAYEKVKEAYGRNYTQSV